MASINVPKNETQDMQTKQVLQEKQQLQENEQAKGGQQATKRRRRGTEEEVEVKRSTFELKTSSLNQIKEIKRTLGLDSKNEVIEKALQKLYAELK